MSSRCRSDVVSVSSRDWFEAGKEGGWGGGGEEGGEGDSGEGFCKAGDIISII